MSRRRLTTTTQSTQQRPAVDSGQWLSWPTHIVAYMTKLADLGAAP
jgi:hypothetical protein